MHPPYGVAKPLDNIQILLEEGNPWLTIPGGIDDFHPLSLGSFLPTVPTGGFQPCQKDPRVSVLEKKRVISGKMNFLSSYKSVPFVRERCYIRRQRAANGIRRQSFPGLEIRQGE